MASRNFLPHISTGQWSEILTYLQGQNKGTKVNSTLKFASPDSPLDLGVFYGLNDNVFLEFLRKLGVRTWDNDGTNKPAYETIICELIIVFYILKIFSIYNFKGVVVIISYAVILGFI